MSTISFLLILTSVSYATGQLQLLQKPTSADVRYYLYTKTNRESPNIILGDGTAKIEESAYSSSRKNVFLIHGWLGNYQSSINVLVRSAILNMYDVNVFVVDWSPISRTLYTTAQSDVPELGEIIGNFLYFIMETYGQSSDEFYLIGHSLGAHIAGCTGKRIHILSNSLVNTVVGLDPAGPLFTSTDTSNRVDPSDGSFVQIIHTNAAQLGYVESLGHSDYYVNGGFVQPGCELDLSGTCSHERSVRYYAESIKSSRFYARECNSLFDYYSGNCNTNRLSIMGQLFVDKSARGNFYLRTRAFPPYAMG